MSRKAAESVYEEPEFENEVYEEASDTNFEIDSDVELGSRARLAPRQAKYPFDKLEVGQSFHVAATADMPKPGTTLAGAVTNANNKWSSEHPTEVETKELSDFAVDENGKRIKNEDGSYQKVGTKVRVQPKRVNHRHFTIRSVGHDDRRGPGARVFRDL